MFPSLILYRYLLNSNCPTQNCIISICIAWLFSCIVVIIWRQFLSLGSGWIVVWLQFLLQKFKTKGSITSDRPFDDASEIVDLSFISILCELYVYVKIFTVWQQCNQLLIIDLSIMCVINFWICNVVCFAFLAVKRNITINNSMILDYIFCHYNTVFSKRLLKVAAVYTVSTWKLFLV